MDEFSNPYRPGAGSAPPVLKGRDELLKRFDVAVRRSLSGSPGKSLMPIGLRGVGKTVLLNRFVELAEDQGMKSAFVEASETGDFTAMFAARIRKLLYSLDSGKATRALTRALGVLKSFSYTLPDGSSMSLNVDAVTGTADSGILSEDLTDILVAVGEAATEQGVGVILAIDEVQYLTETELAAVIAAVHRTVQKNLPVILVGAGLPQLPGLAGDAKSYAERLFDFPMIGSLPELDAYEVISMPAELHDVEFELEAIDAIFEQTQGFPYFLQEWGYHVWNVAVGPKITVDDVAHATDRVKEQLDKNFFLVRTDRLTRLEKRYMSAMAELGPGPHRSGDIASKLNVKVETVAPRRSALIRKGMIFSPSHGETAFTVPMFDEFLRRTQPWDDE